MYVVVVGHNTNFATVHSQVTVVGGDILILFMNMYPCKGDQIEMLADNATSQGSYYGCRYTGMD